MQIAWGFVSLCLIAKQKTCFFQLWSVWHQKCVVHHVRKWIFQRIRIVSSLLSLLYKVRRVAKQHRNGLWTIDFGNQFPLFLVGTSAKIHQKQSWHSKFVCCVNTLASDDPSNQNEKPSFHGGQGPWFAPIKNWRDAGELQTHTEIYYRYIDIIYI